MIRASAVLACSILLAGCAIPGEGLSYATREYRGVKMQTYAIQGAEWRIYDKPKQGRMMIVTGSKSTTASGMAAGATMGLSGYPYTTEAEFRPVAEVWLKAKGCAVTGGRLVVPWQYEFDYRC